MRAAVILVVLFLAVAMSCAETDSSAIIFDDTRIHEYELQFYCTDWEDSLIYYKSLPDEEYMPARMLYRISSADSIVFDSIGVRYKGNSSYAFAGASPKKPFKFRFDKYIDGRRFFGVKKLNFSNGAKDPTMMREKISYDILSRYMAAPRAAFATISIEGELIGLFTQVEQVDKTFLSRYYDDNDGNLFKAGDNGATLLYTNANQSSYEDSYELKTNETENDWSSFMQMLYKLNQSDDAEFVNQVGGVFALDNVCRYLAFNMVFSNFDSYTGSGRNFYLYDDPSSGTFVLIPWDLNLSFGGFTNSWNVYTNDAVVVSNLDERPLNRRIIENDMLRKTYLGYMKEMLDGPAMPDSIMARTEVLKKLLDETVQNDSNKLHTYDEFVKNIDTTISIADGIVRSKIPGLKSFCVQRGEELRAQLEEYLPVTAPYTVVSGNRKLTIRRIRCAGKKVSLSFLNGNYGNTVKLELFNAGGRKILSFGKVAVGTGDREVALYFNVPCGGLYLLKMTMNSGETISRSFMVIQ